MRYRYYLFLDDFLARKIIDAYTIEWYNEGKWEENQSYETSLREALIDYGNYSIGDVKDITEAEANKLISDNKIRDLCRNE